MEFKDYYKALGIAASSTEDEIKTSYRKLARKYHPDVSKEPHAEERFKEIGEAYAVLKDPEKRAAYDQLGSQAKQGQDFTPPPNWDAGFEFSGSGFDPNSTSGQSDFFEALFGQNARNRQNQAFNAKGQDHHAKVAIELNDAYHGCKKSISLKMPTQDSQNRVVMKERKLDVTIPIGIHAGQHLRLHGQGSPGLGNGPAGDLYLEIIFKPNTLYSIDDRDIYMNLPITPWEAALGATVNIPAPNGSVELKIPSGSKSNQKLRLKGRGIPGKTPGDFYAVITIVVPPAETEKAKEAYRAMAKNFDFDPRSNMRRSS